MISQHTISSFKGPPLPRAAYPEKRDAWAMTFTRADCHLCQQPAQETDFFGSPVRHPDGKFRCESCARLATVTPPAKTTASYEDEETATVAANRETAKALTPVDLRKLMFGLTSEECLDWAPVEGMTQCYGCDKTFPPGSRIVSIECGVDAENVYLQMCSRCTTDLIHLLHPFCE